MAKSLKYMREKELLGKKVSLRRELRTLDGVIVGKGTIMTITGKWGGLYLVKDSICSQCACGRELRISRVSFEDVEIV